MDTFWAIIPPVAAIAGAAITKRIIPSLLIGLLAGTFIKSDGNPLDGMLTAGEYLAGAVAEESHAYIILFLFAFGALAEILISRIPF